MAYNLLPGMVQRFPWLQGHSSRSSKSLREEHRRLLAQVLRIQGEWYDALEVYPQRAALRLVFEAIC